MPLVNDIMAELQKLLEDAGRVATEHEDDAPRAARMLDRLVSEATCEVLRLCRQDELERMAWSGMTLQRQRGEA